MSYIYLFSLDYYNIIRNKLITHQTCFTRRLKHVGRESAITSRLFWVITNVTPSGIFFWQACYLWLVSFGLAKFYSISTLVS